MVEKQIAPVLSGVYSGNLYDLTIERTLPYLLDYKEKYGSILKGIEVNKEKFLGNNQKKFLSFQEGMSTMIQTMADQLELTEIWLNRKAEAIEKLQTGYDVVFSNGEKYTPNTLF